MSPAPLTPGPVSSDRATSELVTSESVTSESVTTGAVTTGPAATGAAPTGPAATGLALPGSATTRHDLDVRYGRLPAPGRRRVRRVVGTVALTAALGWVVWAGLGQAGADVRFNDVGYRIVDVGAIDVTYDVNKDPHRTAVCTLQAYDRDKAVVGFVEVRVGPSPERVVRDIATVRTASRPSSAAVQTCTLLP